MDKLIEEASNLLLKKYNPPVHSVAAALETTSGKVITAVNIDHFLGFVCAETAALTIAINQGEYKFKRVVAVRKNEGSNIKITNMCGKCRQIFFDYAPEIQVVTERKTVSINEMLPDPFVRQQQKIQDKVKSVQ